MNRNSIAALLNRARENAFAVGSFSPRNTWLIPYVIKAALATSSPAIIQISSNELKWFDIKPKHFADTFYKAAQDVTVPLVLHLDHTYDMTVIKEAIDAGFQSVMFDGSKHPFEENARLTCEAAEYAHKHGIFLEAELGNIGGADTLETGEDHQHYTNPEQAEEFVRLTGCDSLAVSVGTTHGVYPVKNPKIDFERLEDILNRLSIPLVLHGGSGLPAQTVHQAIHMNGKGGISKLNLATDLELAFQKVTGKSRMADADLLNLDSELLVKAGEAVQALCEDRIKNFLLSENKA